MALARKVDRLVLKREKKMLVANRTYRPPYPPLSIEGDIRTLVRSNKSRSVTNLATTSWPVTTLLLPGRRQSRTSKGLWPNYKPPAIICKLKASASPG